VIVTSGSQVAHLGGWRGDLLRLSRDGGPFELLKDLGWDANRQTTPQRRLLLLEREILVLEPAAGALLAPPLRVRRFDLLSGEETGREEGEGEAGEADLYFFAERTESGVRVRRFGIDSESGAPLRWEGAIDTPFLQRTNRVSGIPARSAGVYWYPFRFEGLQGGEHILIGDPGVPSEVRGTLVCPCTAEGRAGTWIDGRWQALRGRRLFPPGRPSHSVTAAPWGEQGLVFLRREGGELPVLEGPPARLPAGLYTGLADLPGGVHALAEGEPPRLVPLGF
jgi:hypothetical protein